MGNVLPKSDNELKNINAEVSSIEAEIEGLQQTLDQQLQDLAKLSKETDRLKGKVEEKQLKETQDHINSIFKKVLCQPRAQGSVSARREYFSSETLCQNFDEDPGDTQTAFLTMAPKTPNDILKLLESICYKCQFIQKSIDITIFSESERNNMLGMAQFILETFQRTRTYFAQPPQIYFPHDRRTREVPMDHSACAAEVTCGHSVRNDLGNESESNKNDCGYHQEEIFSHTIASVESFMVQLKREGYYDGIFVMKTLTLYWNTLSSYLTSSNPATVNTAKSKLSEIAVLWKEIRNDQELMGIFQYGSFEIIWRYVERIKKEIDEFSDSKGSDQYKSISQFLSNYKFFLQANEIIKSAEKRKLISEIKCISKYFEEKTSRHGDEMTSKTTRMEELGSRDNKHMSKSKVNELRNRYENVESKLPEDAEKRAQNMVDTKVAGDEKTQSMTHDAKKDENKIKLHRIEKRRDEIKQEIDRFEGTTSDPKLHELIEYSVRLILEMDDLSLERGSDLQNKKIALLKEVYQYSDILAKKAQEKEFEQVETYINDIQENFEYHTNSENLKKSKGKIEKVRMRLNGINASIDSQQRKSGLMKMINNIEKILEDTEQKERKREEEVSSSILTEQIEKNKSLTIDADNCEEAIDIFNKNIVPVVGESSDLEKKEEEENIDGVGKINTENNPQEITEKLQQLNLEDRLDTKMPDQSMDLINESNETEVVTSDKNGSNASFTYEKRNDQFVMGAHNKQDLFGYFENRIDKIDKQIHCAFSCRQCDVLKEELLELHEHLEQYVFKNEDDVNINKLKGKLFKSLEFVESRRESLAVIGNEKPKSSETQF